MNFFTSDLHLNHNKEFIYKKRGFNSIKEHDRAIIDNINNMVAEDDYLYILGDICMGDMHIDRDKKAYNYVYSLLKEIKCKNVCVTLGNHDTNTKVKIYKQLGFNVFPDVAHTITINKQKFIISHYPVVKTYAIPTNVDPYPYKDNLGSEVISLFGHTHQKEDFMNKNGAINPLWFHVGVDSNDNHPIEVEEILEKVRNKYDETIVKMKNALN